MFAQFNHYLHILRKFLTRQFYIYTFNFSYIAGVSSIFLTTLIVITLFLGVRQLGWLQYTELFAFDTMMRARPDLGIDPRLLIVKITEADIQLQRRWPLSDATLAQALANLSKYRPAVIGLDVYRDFPQEPGREQFVEQLKKENIVVIRKLSTQDSQGVPFMLDMDQERIGFNDLVVDSDGVIRRNLLYARTNEGIFTSFSLRMALYYLKSFHQIEPQSDATNPDYIHLGHTVIRPLQKNSGGYQNSDASGYQILLNYRSPDIARQVTLTDILNDRVDPSWITQKIVLIGTIASSIKDGFITPYSFGNPQEFHTPGVFFHAQMVSQLLSATLGDTASLYPKNMLTDYRSLFFFWTEWQEILWIIAWASFGAWLTARHSQFPFALFVMGGISIFLLGVFGFALFLYGVWIPIASPLFAFLLSSSSVLIAKLVHHAFYDSLTNLPNRNLFVQKLRYIKIHYIKNYKNHTDKEKRLAVLFIDIERFEKINVALGYEIADILLTKFKKRMFKLLKPHIMLGKVRILARIGGDEFVILLQQITNEAEITLIAEDIAQGMLKPFDLYGDKIFTPINIGIALSTDDYFQNLLQEAQTAMYRAKVGGKNVPTIFESVMERDAIAHFQLERELREAILRDKKYLNLNQNIIASEFPIYYQPIVEFNSGCITGFEALVRWKHPEQGLISPLVFIPVAEETGLIMTIGEWVLQRACEQICVWQQQFNLPSLMISVNLSAKQFIQSNVVEQIEHVLAATQLAPNCLKLEITESVLMVEWEVVERNLQIFKKLGVRISIDDFGTGYSSLAYLTRFPADTLKIDKSFITQMDYEPQSVAVIETIISLAHNLKKEVIAEGVETEEQARWLHHLGCEYGQGYLFAKPMNHEEATVLLAKKPLWRY